MDKSETKEILEDAISLVRVVRGKLELARKSGIKFVAKAGGAKPRGVNKIAALAAIEKDAQACRRCGIGRQRTKLVFARGNPDAELMFIGEAPGYHEDQQGLPFVGPAGQLLDKIIEAMGMKPGDVYIANILKCRPEENRNPTPQEIVLCSPFLERQIEAIAPKVICALGSIAARALLNTQNSIGALRGRFHDYRGVPLMATYHPAYLLRNPADKKKTWEDVKKVKEFLEA